MAEQWRTPTPQVHVSHNRIQVGGVTVVQNHSFNLPPPPIVNGLYHPPIPRLEYSSNMMGIRLDCPASMTTTIQRTCQCPEVTVVNTIHYNHCGPTAAATHPHQSSRPHVAFQLNSPSSHLPAYPNIQFQRPVAETSQGSQAQTYIVTTRQQFTNLYSDQSHR